MQKQVALMLASRGSMLRMSLKNSAGKYTVPYCFHFSADCSRKAKNDGKARKL